jgi:hypothetical protein
MSKRFIFLICALLTQKTYIQAKNKTKSAEEKEYVQNIKTINNTYNLLSKNLEKSSFIEIKNINKLKLTEEEKKFFKDRTPIFKISNFDENSGNLYFYYKKQFAIRLNYDELMSGFFIYLGDKALFVVTDPVNENHQKLLDFFNKFLTDKAPAIKPEVFAKSIALYLKLNTLNI